MPKPPFPRSMSDDTCTRSRADEPSTDAELPAERWLADGCLLDAELPEDVGTALGRLVGRQPVETLGDWLAEVRQRVGGGTIAADDLCHADGETGHRAEMDGETYHFQCFYDAVVLSALADSPVDVWTESPDGTTIEAHATGTDELTVTPETAVFSFGVAESVEPPADVESAEPTADAESAETPADWEPSHADVYAAVCPCVRAFPDADAYARWAATAPAATVAMPLAGATDVAEKLVE